MKILAIETSCDDTSCAILSEENGHLSILANIISSQIELHSEWGGVVPNLAAREHLKNIIPAIDTCLRESHVRVSELDLLAVTAGPGLIPSLLVGTTTAKALSYLWRKPLIGIHHIEGHIYANFLDENQTPEFPILCLVVSGGHTQLIFMQSHLTYEIIGETLDDAVGEAFDKVARLLNLGYPGGPAIAKRASMLDLQNYNAPGKKFPRPMINSDDFNFSFSGLKTAVLYSVKKEKDPALDESIITRICYEFQEATVEVLMEKTIRAAKKFHPKTIMLAGGVSANQRLREALESRIEKEFCGKVVFCAPKMSYSIDNAAMIAAAAYQRHKSIENKEALFDTWKTLQTDPNLKLNSLKI